MDQSITAAARETMRQAILEAGGNEVFFLGRTDRERLVVEAEVLARGSVDAVPAILQLCRYGDVVIHNHPSGDPTPSPEDFDLTERLRSAAELVGVLARDHVIVSAGGYYSFVAAGRWRR